MTELTDEQKQIIKAARQGGKTITLMEQMVGLPPRVPVLIPVDIEDAQDD